MANTLMFEVGIKSAQEQLDKIKQEFIKANGELSKLLNIKVSIDGVDAVTKALSQIGDTSALRSLRSEIAALNREFSILSKGAGGSGDIAGRGLAADIERTSQSIDRYTSKIKQLTEERTRLVGGTRNSSYQNYTDEILRYEQSLEGARKKLAQLNEQKNQSVASEPLKKATQDAQAFETALGRIETAIGGLKSGMSVNLTGDFSKWAQEVQNVTAYVRELVGQLQKITTPEGLKTFTETAQSALSRLREEAEKIQNTFGKFSDRAEAFKHIQNSIGGGVWFSANGKQIDQIEHAKSLIRTLNDEKTLQKELNELRSKYPAGSLTDQKLSDFRQLERTYVEMINLLRRVREEEEKMGKTSVQVTAKASQQLNQPVQQGSVFDPQKFNTLQEAIDKIISEINRLQQAFTKLGENSSLSNLSTMINGLAVTLSTLSNAIKIQPLDEQVKALLERCEKAEAKLREVGDAAKYLNERAGAKTQQKASSIMGITGTDEEQLNKVSSTAERFMRLLVEIENQMAKIGKIQALGEQSGFSPTLLKNAQAQLDALKKMVESTIKGTPIADGLVIPASNSQLAQFIQQFGLLKAQYRDIIKEADRFNKVTSKDAADAAKNAEKDNKKWADSMDYAKTKANELRLTIEKMERLKTVGINLGLDTSSLSAQIDRLKQNLNTLYGMMGGAKMGGTAQEFVKSSAFKIPLADANAASNILKSSDAYKEASANMKAAETEARRLKVTISNLEAYAKKADAMGIDTSKLRTQIADLKIYKQTLENIASGTNLQSVKKFVTSDWFLETKREVKDATSYIKKEMNNALKPDNEGANALKEYVSLLRQITSLTGTANKAESLGIDTQTLRNQIALLENYAKTIEQFLNNKGAGFNAWMQATPVYTEARGNIAADQAKMNTLIAEKKNENKMATVQLSESEQRLANAVKSTSDSMRGQSQVLSDLKMLATQYLSVWGAQSLVNSIIETGGQLEQQRLSLSAILGDMGKATTLFEQIKGMALKSPFGVVELDKMSKQLAAYSFEYEELFDWTKRLADISAATGTSVDRLALALGHVRSEGALSGYTLRQFAMANVPVLRMLSENLGISSKEVRERVKKKEISAEDVQDILKQLTEDGGMFANAQETMSEALNAKFKNLRDAFDIMYGEIAESGVGDKLKDLAVILTNGAKHWERLATDVKDVAITFGIVKVATLMYNNALGKGTAITLKSALASKQKEIANLELTASYRKLTQAELDTMAMSGKLNATNITTLLSTKKLTYAELERAVALGKVDKAVALAALDTLGMHKQMALLRNIAPLQGLSRVWAVIGYNIKLATLAVKSFFASAWPLLALTAGFELWNRRNEQRDNANDLAKTMAGNARGQEAYEMRDSLADSRKLSEEALKQNIIEMQNALVAANAYTEELKKQVEATDDLTRKYDILKVKIGEVADKYEELKSSQEKMLNEAWDAGGSWLTDNMLEDTKDFDAALAEYQKKLTIGSKQIKGVLSEWLRNQGQFKEEYASMTGKQIFETIPEKLQKDFLYYASWNGNGMEQATREIIQGISRAYNVVGAKLTELQGDQGRKFAATIKSMYEEAYHVDLDKADQEQANAFDQWLRKTLERAEGLSKEAKEALRNIVIDFSITLKPNYVVEQPQTAADVISEQLGDNKWLSGFFSRQNGGTPTTWTVEQAQKEVKKYNKLFGDISLSNLDTAPKKLNTLLDGLEETKTNLQNTLSNGLLDENEKKEIDKSLKETTDSIDLANKALKDVGGKRKRKGEKSGSKEDKEAKVLRERVRILKEAADSYQYWREKVGEAGAETHMQDEFGQLLTEQNLQLKNAEELRAKLKALRDEYSQKPQTKAMVEAIKEIDKELAQLDRKDFERDTERFLSKTQIELDNLTRSWETFNSVREATGNVKLAIELSGAEYANGKAQNLADAIKEKIKKDFASVGAIPIPFDINLSDEQIGDTIKTAMPKANEEQIKGFIEEYKKWRDLQRDVEQKDIDTFGKLIGSAVDLQTELSKVADEYARIIQSLDRMKAKGQITGTQYNQAKAVADANMQMKTVQAQNEFKFLMDGVVTLSKKAAQTIRDEYVNALQKQLSAGVITAKDYADKIQEINDKMKQLEEAPSYFRSYMQGGFQGFFENMMNRGKSMTEQGAAMFQQGTKESNLSKMMQGNQMSKMGANMMQGAQSAMGAIGMIDTIIHGIDDLVQGLKNTFDDIRNMFEALGHDVKSDAWEDANTFLSSFSKASASATKGWDSLKNGNIGGVIEGVVGSVTGWITGFAKGHDQKLQNHIDALKENVTALQENTDAIKAARNRTLGYDFGELRKRMAQQYNELATQLKHVDVGWDEYDIDIPDYTQIAMKNYYGKNGDRSGYQAELDNLKEQRQLYMDMYNIEKEKKDQSEEALKEYREKIADLDDQILYFVEDLTKELWGIDFQSWSSQISDALWTAFENGEDAVKAFHDTAKDIIADVAKKMMNIHLIEPVFSKLEDLLFGEIGANGQRTGGTAYNAATGQFNEEETLRILGQFFGEDGEFAKVIDSAESFYKMAEKATGFDFTSEDSSKTTSGGIKSITEQTADLLASYVNATRASTSNIENLSAQYFPMYYNALTSGNASLRNLEEQARLTAQNTDAIKKNTAEVVSLFNGLKNKAWKVPMA